MNKITALISAGLLSLTLAGCATTGPTTIITQQVPVVVAAPDTLYVCPQVNKFPAPDTLTNAQLATLIVTLVKNNKVCGANMGAIKSYVDKARMQILTNNKKKGA